jgi:hypothetical protein
MYVTKTCVYLTEEALDGANNIIAKLPSRRGVRITARTDAVNLALVEMSYRLDREDPLPAHGRPQ